MSDRELEPISPSEAKSIYLAERKEDAAYATRRTIDDGTALFVKWTNSENIDNMNEITGRNLQQFKNWCKENSGNNTVSLNGILSVLRRFLVFCVRIEAVTSDLPAKVPMPTVPEEEEVCDEKPSDDEVEATLEFLERYAPASRRHVEYRAIKEIAFRIGALRSIDEEDVELDDEEPKIKLKHRPEKEHKNERGTPLKNGKDGERHVNISTELADLIQRYLDNPDRHDVEGEFGRKPLLTTEDGRPSLTTIRRDLYKLTRPCEYSGECPHGRDIDSCEYTRSSNASECPSSHSPHPLRRWSIEHQIERGVSKELLSDRVDVSVPVLNKHYDRRTEERKRKHRLEVLEKVFAGYGSPEATIDAGVLVDMLDNGRSAQEIMKLLTNKPDGESKTESDSESESTSDESSTGNQATFDQFDDGLSGCFHPISLPIMVVTAIGRWLPIRLIQEFNHLTSEPGASLPTKQRAVKGVVAYFVFISMIALNLTLLQPF